MKLRNASDEELVCYYEQEQLSTIEIAARYNVQPSAVRKRLLRAGVALRGKAEATRIGRAGGRRRPVWSEESRQRHSQKFMSPEVLGPRIATTLRNHFLTATQAARALGLDRSHVGSLLRAGKFPGAFQVGEREFWLVPKVSVEAYRERRRKQD
jgi:hypothetical protein